MGFLDSIKRRIGFGDDAFEDWDDPGWDDADEPTLTARPRSERSEWLDRDDRPERPARLDDTGDVSPAFASTSSLSRASVRLTSTRDYPDAFSREDDSAPAYTPSTGARQSRGVITGRGPVVGGIGEPIAQQPAGVSMSFIEPRSFADVEVLGERFRRGQTVILNMNASRPELAKRVLDFASGLTYALEGSIQKVGDRVFILTPKNVEISDADRRRLREVGIYGDDA